MVEPDGAASALLGRVVPGSQLREGLDRILKAHMGALVVLGDGPDVLSICSGGFHIDAEMNPQRLSELAKMDGAIILDRDARRIAWANVHLIPDPSAPTTETGTRHRTAERVARSLDVAVVAVSEENGTITLYRGAFRRQLQDPDSLIGRANHLLQTLDRFRARLDEVADELDRAELDGRATLGHAATVLQRTEMVTRVARSVAELVTELGAHGRLLRLQLEELSAGVAEERRLVCTDYVEIADDFESLDAAAAIALGRLSTLSTDEVLSLEAVAAAVTGRAAAELAPFDLEATVSPRGLRLLRRLPHLEPGAIEAVLAGFHDLRAIRTASLAELADCVGEEDALRLHRGLERLAEGRHRRAPARRV